MRPRFLVGRRGACLLFFGVLDLLYALSLWQPVAESKLSPTARFIAGVAPLPWWAALWALVGIICLAGAACARYDRIAFSAAIGIKTLWGGVFLLGWLAGAIERGWVAAVIWLGLACMVGVLAGWPEPPAAPPASGEE